VLEPLLIPVPPLAGSNVPVKVVIREEDILAKSEPFQAIMAFSPLAMVTPVVYVGPGFTVPRTIILWLPVVSF